MIISEKGWKCQLRAALVILNADNIQRMGGIQDALGEDLIFYNIVLCCLFYT